MTQKELEQLFSQYGRIITSRILVDQVTGEYSMTASPRLCSIFTLSRPSSHFPPDCQQNDTTRTEKCIRGVATRFPKMQFSTRRAHKYAWMEYKIEYKVAGLDAS